MTAYRTWLFLHILLFVCWLGMDLAVLMLVRAARRPALSFAVRAFALNMATAIGLVPRLCLALTLPVALQVVHSGFRPQPAWLLVLAWLLGVAWTGLVIAAARGEDRPPSMRLGRALMGVQAATFVLLVAAGVSSLVIDRPLPWGWPALKALLLAVILIVGVGVDYAFRPVIPAFARLVKEGTKPDIEAPIASGIDAATRYVVTVYALLILSALLGVFQPL
jgi:hypothetical protein